MDAFETTGEIMNEVEWRKDGETGCLMTVVKTGAFTLFLGFVVAGGYWFGHDVLVNLWW